MIESGVMDAAADAAVDDDDELNERYSLRMCFTNILKKKRRNKIRKKL